MVLSLELTTRLFCSIYDLNENETNSVTNLIIYLFQTTIINKKQELYYG